MFSFIFKRGGALETTGCSASVLELAHAERERERDTQRVCFGTACPMSLKPKVDLCIEHKLFNGFLDLIGQHDTCVVVDS